MKNYIRFLGIISMAAVIALAFTACPIGPGPTPPGPEPTPTHTHQWGDWSVTTAATCSATGVETRTCALDPSHKETQDIPINPDAHVLGDNSTITKAPTCTEGGLGSGTCALNPSHILSDSPIPALGHDYQNWTQTTAPTCTTAGVETGTCTRDQVTTTRPKAIDPNAHNWGNWTVTTPATEIQGGVEISTCSRCGQTQTRVTPPTGSGNPGTLPDAPINITVSAISSSSITIIWTPVPSAYEYYVYRSSSASATYSRVAISPYMFFTDSELSEGSTYFYKVSAHNDTGEGPQSASVSATTSISTPIPNAPTNVTATVEATAIIRINWSAVSEAESYVVYCSESVDFDFNKHGTSSYSTSAILYLSPETVYYIVVCAINSSGQSPHSSPVSVTTKAMMPGTGGNIRGRWGFENGIRYIFTNGDTYRVFFYSEFRSQGWYSVSNGILTLKEDQYYSSHTYSYSVSETGDTLTIADAYGYGEILPRLPDSQY